MVEIVQRHDQPDVVLAHEVGQRLDVSGVGDARHDRPEVRVVERGRERIRVGSQRTRPGRAEGADDVHPLARAGEQDGRHDARGYSEGRWGRLRPTRSLT